MPTALEGSEKAQLAEADARKTAEREREKLAAAEYGYAMQVTHKEWYDCNFRAMRALLDGARPRRRGWEWHYLNRLHDSSLLTLKGHASAVQAAYSSDGSNIVTAESDGTARVWDAKTGHEQLALSAHADGVFSAMFSPDSSRILTTGRNSPPRVWDSKTGAALLTLGGAHERSAFCVVQP